MIRFPERFHASTTPATREVRGIEPNYRETKRASKRRPCATPTRRAPPFDFSALLTVLG